jgi:hypothetical protein
MTGWERQLLVEVAQWIAAQDARLSTYLTQLVERVHADDCEYRH